MADPQNPSGASPVQAVRSDWWSARKRGKKPKGKKNDIIIALMGPTGIGKSTFINTAVGGNVAPVGHQLNSCTTAVLSYSIPHPNLEDLNVVFVDTPGFNDTYLDDSEILDLIAAWLKNSYEKGTKLSGIIYLHEICQARMFGTSRKSLNMFGKLCGDKAVKNVILATTKWSRVVGNEGQERERELAETYWKEMLAHGSTMDRFTDTHESAWNLVNVIIEKEPIGALLIQEELVDLQRKVPETEAGKTLRTTLRELAQKMKGQSQGNEEMEIRLVLTLEQLRKLKVPLGRKLTIFLSFKKAKSRALSL